ncbi:MAG: CCC motif membrane protein [Chitinophagaceae bacterium]
MENRNEFRDDQNFYSGQTALPNATAVLVLGIISIVGCFCYGVVGLICSIIALVLYSKDKKVYLLSPQSYTPGSYSNLNAGRICAIIGLIISALYFLLIIGFLIFFGTAFLHNPQDFIRQMQQS